MRKKLGNVIIYSLMLSVFVSMTSFAVEENNYSKNKQNIVIDVQKYDSAEKLYEEINRSIQEYEEVQIINIEDNDIFDSESNIETRAAADAVAYKVSDIKNLSNSYGSDFLNVSGAPGITIGLSNSKTKSYSIDVGATYNCPKNMIANAAWGTTSAKTLTYSGTWKVPTTYGGKAVKYGYLHMRPEFSVKQATIYYKNYGTSTWIKKGTTQTKRAYGVNIYKTYVYK